jgi:NDP-sugar pyrophosphorylase family protein
MQAFILAGGKGTRLQPYTTVFPKPMLPIGGRPIIEIIIAQLAYFGFNDIVISLGYLGDYIRMYFEDKKKIPPGVRLRYVVEDTPLGTAGSVSLLENPEESFLVINGDILSTLDYRDFMQYHKSRESILTLAVGLKKVAMSLGILELGPDNTITNFTEKPTYTYNDNMGIYIYKSDVLRYIKKSQRLDLNDLVMDLLRHKEKVCGYISEAPYYWIDIGKSGDYEAANSEFDKRRDIFHC